MPKKILDPESTQRRWFFSYTLQDKRADRWSLANSSKYPPRVFFVEFAASSHEEALRRTLDILKRVVRRLKTSTLFMHILSPVSPLPGEECLTTDEMYRLKDGFELGNNRRILAVENPSTCFVRGYGSEALAKLQA